MEELINIDVRIENDRLITDSKCVALRFNKRHDHIMRDIEKLKKDFPTNGEMFNEGFSTDEYGRDQRIYIMNKDGFMLLAMGFQNNTEAVKKWKLEFIEAFNKLELFYNSPEQVMARALKIADNTINSLKVENKTLHNENDLLTKQQLEWADRPLLNAIIRKYATAFKIEGNSEMYVKAWRRSKRELLYNHGINIKSRITSYLNETGKKTKPPTLDMIHDDELSDAIATAVSLCKEENIDISDIINNKAGIVCI